MRLILSVLLMISAQTGYAGDGIIQEADFIENVPVAVAQVCKNTKNLNGLKAECEKKLSEIESNIRKQNIVLKVTECYRSDCMKNLSSTEPGYSAKVYFLQ